MDGVMGARTRAALADFQRSRGMTPTGRVNLQTLAALRVGPRRTPGMTYRAPGAMTPAPRPTP
ncbi:MAG TPA: peptidoglycan-binding domain-containing protein [Roseiarcus sp.]|nr:peptidoglycan-binding domain-containing protein [Roseiarcus sp.]